MARVRMPKPDPTIPALVGGVTESPGNLVGDLPDRFDAVHAHADRRLLFVDPAHRRPARRFPLVLEQAGGGGPRPSHLAGLRLQHADSLAVLLDGDGVPLASPRRTGAVRLRREGDRAVPGL